MFGFLARIARTVFIRRAGIDAMAQREMLSSRMSAGDSLFLFPEGTSTDGSHVQPFKSSLFSVAYSGAQGVHTVVQPVSIAYPRFADGSGFGPDQRGLFAWFGDMDLAPHLWQVFGMAGAEVEVRFHPPVSAWQFPTRKHLAQHCEDVVARGLALSLGNGGGVSPLPQPSTADAA